MSRAGKFIPGGSGRKSGPLAPGGPIRAGDAPAGTSTELVRDEKKKLFPKGGLRKAVPKNRRLPITVMSGVFCGLLVWAADYIVVVHPAKLREQEQMQKFQELQKAHDDEVALEKKKEAEDLAKQSAARITVRVGTQPAGANVTLGEFHKITPATFSDIPPGNYTLLVHLDGYEDYQQKITAEADKPLDLGAIPLVRQLGNLSLASSQSSVTYVLSGPGGYTHEGTVPDKIQDLPVGSYQLVATQHDWKLAPITLVVRPKENVQETVKFPYASLLLTSTPPGATVRNGRTVLGVTPLDLKEMHPGMLHLSLDLPPYTLQRLDLNLPDSGNTSSNVTLAKNKDFVAAAGIPMVWIPAGFWAGKYEVTQAQFEPVAKYNPSTFRRPNRPVENISWDGATAFCEKLTEYERKAGKLPEGYHYTLPTESQWATLSADADIDQAATSRNGSLSSTQDVGSSEPNKYGIYDTLGNVWEWCLDTVDDQGDHSLRGGSWLSSVDNFPNADTRIVATPKNADRFTGFRVVLVPQ